MRKFPAWYKPYMFNYTGDGYLVGLLGMFALFGYSYLEDIKQAKGRRQRFVYESDCQSEYEKSQRKRWSTRQIEKGDPSWTKYTQPKQRAHAHH